MITLSVQSEHFILIISQFHMLGPEKIEILRDLNFKAIIQHPIDLFRQFDLPVTEELI